MALQPLDTGEDAKKGLDLLSPDHVKSKSADPVKSRKHRQSDHRVTTDVTVENN